MRVSLDITDNAMTGAAVQNGQIVRKSSARFDGGIKALLRVLSALEYESAESVAFFGDAFSRHGNAETELKKTIGCAVRIPCRFTSKSQCALRFAQTFYGFAACAAISFDRQIGLSASGGSGQSEYLGLGISHAVLIPEGRKCACGKRGCAVQYFGESNLIKYLHATEKNINDLKDVRRFLKDNQKLMRAVRRRAGEIRAFAESVAAIRGVNRIILCGTITQFPWMRERISQAAGSCEILFSDQDQLLVGATL